MILLILHTTVLFSKITCYFCRRYQHVGCRVGRRRVLSSLERQALVRICTFATLYFWQLTAILLTLKVDDSGKGTISNWIVRDFGLTHVSSGDLLRANLRY